MNRTQLSSTALRTVLLTCLSVCTAAVSSSFDSWPGLNYYAFIDSGDSKTLSGRGSTECNFDPSDPSTVASGDQFHNIGIIAGKYNGGACYPWSGNSDANFLVEKGTLSAGDGNSYDAYKIHPAQIGATSFTASKPTLVFKFDAGFEAKYNIYEVVEAENAGEAAILTKVDEVTPDTVDHFVLTSVIGPMNGGGVTTIYAVVPSSVDVSIWPSAPDGSTTRKATIFDTTDLALYAELFEEDGIDPFEAKTDFNKGPSHWEHRYGSQKYFTKVTKDNGATDGVVWQDQTSEKIYVTWETSSGHTTINLARSSGHILVAAASNSDGDIIYLTMKDTSNGDKVTSLSVKGYKVSDDGNQLMSKNFNTKKSGGLDVYEYFQSGSSLVWDHEGTNKLGWMLSRKMTKSGDGLNHQGCIMVILDGNNLDVVSNTGQTSGHSWNNFITLDEIDSNYPFMAVDLGDNYPRGIHTHRFTSTGSRQRKVVYTFKTEHGQTAKSPSGAVYDKYTEISTPEKTFYKWSNDNNVYTEIAHPAAIQADGKYIMIFASEFPSLDNSITGSTINAPRNLGFVALSSDFSTIVSDGDSSTGGFYNFGGGWSSQSNEGIIQLTDFTPDETDSSNWDSATRIKAAKVGDDDILLFYEVWSPSKYRRTEYMVIDTSGDVVTSPTRMPFPLRLNPTDEIEVTDDGNIKFYAGWDNTITKYYLKLKGSSGPGPTPDEPSPHPSSTPTGVQPSPHPSSAPSPSSGPPCDDAVGKFKVTLSSNNKTKNKTCSAWANPNKKWCDSEPEVRSKCPKSCNACGPIEPSPKPSSAPSPSSGSPCADTVGRVEVTLSSNNNKKRSRTCSVWANSKKKWCDIEPEVRSKCPKSCNACDPTDCVDAEGRVEAEVKGNVKSKKCSAWANPINPNKNWCDILEISEQCPKSCNSCS